MDEWASTPSTRGVMRLSWATLASTISQLSKYDGIDFCQLCHLSGLCILYSVKCLFCQVQDEVGTVYHVTNAALPREIVRILIQ